MLQFYQEICNLQKARTLKIYLQQTQRLQRPITTTHPAV